MTERERKAVEALKATLLLVKAFTGPDDAIAVAAITGAQSALAAYDTPDNPPMVPWEEFKSGREYYTDNCVFVGGHEILEDEYNAIRNALKGGA